VSEYLSRCETALETLLPGKCATPHRSQAETGSLENEVDNVVEEEDNIHREDNVHCHEFLEFSNDAIILGELRKEDKLQKFMTMNVVFAVNVVLLFYNIVYLVF
jgi:hypothetical protein